MTTMMLVCMLLLAEAPSVRVDAPGSTLVLPLVANAGLAPEQAGLVTGALAAELARASGARVQSFRELQDRYTPEQVQGAAACVAVACAVELAAIVGADQVILGDVGRLGDSYVLNVLRVDVRRGEVAARASIHVEGERVDALLDDLPRLARKVSGAPLEKLGDGKPGAERGWDFGRVTALLLRIAGLACLATVPLPLLIALAVAAAGTVTSAIFGLAVDGKRSGVGGLPSNPTFLIGFIPTMVGSGVVGLFFLLPLALGLGLLGGSFLAD